ncbi:MAG: hypothetical protein HC780_17230 [Leptolyngbyaceae cyanobacterium CSU_1_3]|nr:hypothetical protein [Leptolyngbyaceae cyanobacterium CSU_1_3]
MSVAWNSIKQGFHRTQEGNWHRKETPDDNVISSGTESSAILCQGIKLKILDGVQGWNPWLGRSPHTPSKPKSIG